MLKFAVQIPLITEGRHFDVTADSIPQKKWNQITIATGTPSKMASITIVWTFLMTVQNMTVMTT